MWRRAVFALSLSLLVPALPRAAREFLPRATPESVGLTSARLKDATALLNQFVADSKGAGAVAAVARHGKLAYLEAVGVQDLETRTPMTERSLFRSGTGPLAPSSGSILRER